MKNETKDSTMVKQEKTNLVAIRLQELDALIDEARERMSMLYAKNRYVMVDCPEDDEAVKARAEESSEILEIIEGLKNKVFHHTEIINTILENIVL